MFDNYLSDKKEYLLLESYIYNKFWETKNKNDWLAPYYNTQYLNEVYFYDANPIFSAINNNEHTIIKIVLDEDICNLLELEDIIDNNMVFTFICNVTKVEELMEIIFHKFKNT